MKNIYKTGVCVLAAMSLLIFGGSTVAAQEGEPSQVESITMSPVGERLEVQPGQVVTKELTIVNDGQLPYEFIVYSRPYSIQNEQYDPDFTATPTNADAYKWVRFGQTKYSIKAGETIKVPYTINIPADALPGGHYGVVFAETQPAMQEGQNAVARKKRVGAILYVTVAGEFTRAGQPLSVTVPFWQNEAPLHATIRSKNSGTTDFRTTMTMTVRDVFGNVKFKESKEYPLLPQTVREMRLEWAGAPWFGLFKVEVSQKLLEKEMEQNTYVLMMPRFLPIVAAVFIVLGVGYAVYRRRSA